VNVLEGAWTQASVPLSTSMVKCPWTLMPTSGGEHTRGHDGLGHPSRTLYAGERMLSQTQETHFAQEGSGCHTYVCGPLGSLASQSSLLRPLVRRNLKTIHVTADITQAMTLGARDALGDSNIATADLSDPSGHRVGRWQRTAPSSVSLPVIRSSRASSQSCFPLGSWQGAQTDCAGPAG
jgi:hypothetical protein